jgi:hypothetical protein
VTEIPILKRDPAKEHPAQWSAEILKAMTPALVMLNMAVHDPFAGTGVRLGALCKSLGLTFTGTEMVREFIVDERVKPGDSTTLDGYPAQPYAIVTSPVYPNGMADHFKAAEPETRHTYRQALHRLRGEDSPLSERNMGRWSIRSGTKAFERYATLASCAISWWYPSVALVNVSDFYVGDDIFPLVRFWRELLGHAGYKFAADIEVKTRRQGHGANGKRRVDHETVLCAFPKAPSGPAAYSAEWTYRKLDELLGGKPDG